MTKAPEIPVLKSGAVGKEIALYVYDTNGDSGAADGRNIEGAVAYISGGYYGPTSYRLDALEVDGNRATGSILVDFDSLQKSVLEGRTENSSTQKALKIIKKNDYFLSTVSDAVAKKSAGTFHVWQNSDNPQ